MEGSLCAASPTMNYVGGSTNTLALLCMCRLPLHRKESVGVSIFAQPFPGLWRSEMVMRERGDMASFVTKTLVSCGEAPRLSQAPGVGRVGGGRGESA